ncbi:hypothetical protein AGMMS49921_13640 [Endomicrobiia bacterium]|nr:hypothetical protein AGMMS49921_13640 [Endomicrobiia bacterium]
MSYDKKIIKGNKLKLTLKEVTEYLLIDYKETDVIVKVFKRAFKELNEYEFDKNYDLKVELIKEKEVNNILL